jgi:RNA methyltransferase, TrmH family
MRLLTLARDLTRRKARERDHLFVAEGLRAVEELARSPLEITGVLAGPQLAEHERGRRLREQLAARGTVLSDVSEREFASAAGTESPQGVLAVAPVPPWSLADLVGRSTLRLVVLDALQDPGNVGTILRTAAALGADATIALPGTVDVWNAKVVRSAMGAHFRNPAFHVSWEELLDMLTSEQVALWGADARGVPLAGGRAPGRLALAVGNEGGGLSPQVRAQATHLVSLPLAGGAESLNVAVAAGILLYELRPA